MMPLMEREFIVQQIVSLLEPRLRKGFSLQVGKVNTDVCIFLVGEKAPVYNSDKQPGIAVLSYTDWTSIRIWAPSNGDRFRHTEDLLSFSFVKWESKVLEKNNDFDEISSFFLPLFHKYYGEILLNDALGIILDFSESHL